MFGNASQPSRVYAYGARAPRTHADLVHAQLELARRYRNALVEQEHARRAAVAAVLTELHPGVAEAEADIARIDAAIEAAEAATRRMNQAERRKAPRPEERAHLKELRRQRKLAYQKLKGEKAEAFADPVVKERLAQIDEDDRTARIRIRAEYSASISWGTRGTIEQGLSGIRTGAPPRFVGRQWPGKLAVQLQTDNKRGIQSPTWAELIAGAFSTQIRVEQQPLPPNAEPNGRRSRRPWCILHMRIGSDGRVPIFAEIPFVLHRPIPADARIKWVYLVRRRVATHDKWSVQFVVSRESWTRADTATAAGTVAINLGYRTLDDGSVRVAYVVGSDNYQDQLIIRAEERSRWSKVESLQSIRDREFALARDRLVARLSEYDGDLPEWMSEALSTLAQWRSQARLAGLVLRWRENRFAGDDAIYKATEAWRKRDKHLYEWQAHQRLHAERWRDDHYRRFAARLRWRYARVVMDSTDWTQLLRRPAAEDDTEQVNLRARARIASPGLLRTTIEQGGPVECIRLPSTGITRTCSACGAEAAHDWDAVTEIMYRCAAGHVIDQDENACRNMLRAAEDGRAGA